MTRFVPALHRKPDPHRQSSAMGGRLIIFPVAFQLTCKFPYLFFPLDIHDSPRIVVEAVVQESEKLSLEFCPFEKGSGNDDHTWLRTRQSTPNIRSFEIGSWSSRYLVKYLCASEGRTKNDRQRNKTPSDHISTSPMLHRAEGIRIFPAGSAKDDVICGRGCSRKCSLG